MSSFAVLLLCIQACLVQNICQACPGASVSAIVPARVSPCGLAAQGRAFGLASDLAYDRLVYPAAGYGAAAYGGSGEGNVAVAGELPVSGNTAVAGQVPIMGAVSFSGPAAAAGGVSISGKCACGAEVAGVSGLTAPCRLAAPALAASCGKAAPAWGLAYPSADFVGRSLAYDGIYAPNMEFSPTSGGALPVSSASAIAPTGISVMSDNAYEGVLAVDGELPFVSTVTLEGLVPSGGAGAVNYACGNGRTAMISETAAFAPAAAISPLAACGAGAAFTPAAPAGPGLGLRGGWAGRACGCAM
ncbi:hypothetical protein PYW08_011349 [Mythimna loreyi]|uniref:Uncharacterized protein n=1 Tax=Mythimna loreyi TaxID=667449 RepID=A0ACC2Q6R0_9NEOP|nr:hypothetical protein PYW08_011349 [Mythimna loreyi]